MIGAMPSASFAIAGDIIGSIYEINKIKTKEFPLFSPDCRFTDDTVPTIAVVDILLNGGNYTQSFKNYCRRYHNAGYGANFGYDLDFSIDQIRPNYQFNASCQGFVPEAIVAFLESTDFEDAIRNAISTGGDSDTIACIAGGVARAFYGGVPNAIAKQALSILDEPLHQIVEAFHRQYLNL